MFTTIAQLIEHIADGRIISVSSPVPDGFVETIELGDFTDVNAEERLRALANELHSRYV